MQPIPNFKRDVLPYNNSYLNQGTGSGLSSPRYVPCRNEPSTGFGIESDSPVEKNLRSRLQSYLENSKVVQSSQNCFLLCVSVGSRFWSDPVLRLRSPYSKIPQNTASFVQINMTLKHIWGQPVRFIRTSRGPSHFCKHIHCPKTFLTTNQVLPDRDLAMF